MADPKIKLDALQAENMRLKKLAIQQEDDLRKLGTKLAPKTGMKQGTTSSTAKAVLHQKTLERKRQEDLAALREKVDQLENKRRGLKEKINVIQQTGAPGVSVKLKVGWAEETKDKDTKSGSSHQEDETLITQLRSQLLNINAKIRELMSTTSTSQAEGSVDEKVIVMLQQELRDKSTALKTLQIRYETLEAAITAINKECDALNAKEQRMREQLQEDRRKTQDLELQAKRKTEPEGSNVNIASEIEQLTSEIKTLEQQNRDLRGEAFKGGQSRDAARAAVNEIEKLKTTNSTLEEQKKKEIAAKQRDIQRLGSLQQQNSELRAAKRTLEQEVAALTEEEAKLNEKLHLFDGKSTSFPGATGSAPVTHNNVLHHQLQVAQFASLSPETADFVKKVRLLRVSNAELVRDLQKTRHLLTLQDKLNRERDFLASTGNQALQFVQSEYDRKIDGLERKLSHLMEKNERLQLQLRHSTKGEGDSKLPDGMVRMSVANLNSSIALSEADLLTGKNILQFVISRVILDRNFFADVDPCTFIMFDFFMHPTQTTDLFNGIDNQVTFAREFVVTMDKLLLHYLSTDTLSLDLVLVNGMDYQVVGSAEVVLGTLLDPKPMLNNVARVVAPSGAMVGTVEYGMRLAAPLSESARLLAAKEKRSQPQALRSRQHNASIKTSSPILDPLPPLNSVVEIVVRVVAVTELTIHSTSSSSSLSMASSAIPASGSIYVSYQLLNFPEHSTHTIANSSSASSTVTFDDEYRFQVTRTNTSDILLLSSEMVFAVFDDNCLPTDARGVIGAASISLAPLLQAHRVNGWFPLRNRVHDICGRIHIDVGWGSVLSESKVQDGDASMTGFEPWARKAADDLKTTIEKRGKTLEEAFRVFDRDYDDHLSAAEFHEAVTRDVPMNLSKQQEEDLFGYLDADHDGSISLIEFTDVLLRKIDPTLEQTKRRGAASAAKSGKNVWEQQTCIKIVGALDGQGVGAESRFAYLDQDGDDLLSVGDLTGSLNDKLKLQLSSNDITRLHLYLDAYNDGVVDKNEFLQRIQEAVEPARAFNVSIAPARSKDPMASSQLDLDNNEEAAELTSRWEEMEGDTIRAKRTNIVLPQAPLAIPPPVQQKTGPAIKKITEEQYEEDEYYDDDDDDDDEIDNFQQQQQQQQRRRQISAPMRQTKIIFSVKTVQLLDELLQDEEIRTLFIDVQFSGKPDNEPENVEKFRKQPVLQINRKWTMAIDPTMKSSSWLLARGNIVVTLYDENEEGFIDVGKAEINLKKIYEDGHDITNGRLQLYGEYMNTPPQVTNVPVALATFDLTAIDALDSIAK